MLVTLKEILKEAREKKYAVGAFNAPNLESLLAVMQAAEEEQVPVIIQHAEVHNDLIPLDIIGPIMLDQARKASVPVVVHLDHGSSFSLCMKAMKLGFTSIMYDASTKPFEVNIEETKEIVKIAHSLGVSVEAELGHMLSSSVGAGEGKGAVSLSDYASTDDCYTNPEQAKIFVEETGVDALAISFGTAHGIYLQKPVLDLDRITKIKEKIDIPFVMHGGSGVSDEDFRTAINNGITKINYYTYMALAGAEKVAEYINSHGPEDKIFFHDLSIEGIRGMKENVRKAMRVFYGK
ncbi:class II fructose-bisphosphate aldolase [Alloiococcus sp. CFN-8]|uniref:class II fructose-bisphosphate aldolase n=1 Tax=Alloiococcus sp. CFN-8 TaxID=3416081 RepID=UPI003CF4CC51